MSKNNVANMSKEEILAMRAKNYTKGMTTLDAIRAYYTSDLDIELTEKQKEIHERLLFTYAQIMRNKPSTFIQKLVAKKYNLTPRHALNIYKDAINLFGDVTRAEKEGIRHITYEMQMKIYRKAIAKGDLKEANSAVSNIIKLQGLDREDPDLPDFEKLKGGVYPIVLDNPIRDALLSLVNGHGSLDLTQLIRNIGANAETVEIEEEESDRPDQDRNQSST
jgi:hypothetical protein